MGWQVGGPPHHTAYCLLSPYPAASPPPIHPSHPHPLPTAAQGRAHTLRKVARELPHAHAPQRRHGREEQEDEEALGQRAKGVDNKQVEVFAQVLAGLPVAKAQMGRRRWAGR